MALGEPERLGTWLAENRHLTLARARCPESDGRLLAKIVEYEGHRFAWFASSKIPPIAWSNELDELLREAKNQRNQEVADSVATLMQAGGGVETPPQAFPIERDARAVVSCPGCRRHYEARAESGVLSVSRLPDEQL